MDEALEGLHVQVVQGASDEAKGLLRHVERDLGAHHSPDLFHVRYAVSKATALPLARALEQAERTAERARDAVAAQPAARDDVRVPARRRARPTPVASPKTAPPTECRLP